jgi:broad specificity phosphatase PhoE
MSVKKRLNIFLVRHGEKDESGEKLTSRGRAQAKHLAKRMKKLEIDKIYSSDIARCKETAEIINKKLNLQIHLEKLLREVKGEVKENPSKFKKEINIIKKFHQKISKEKGNILVVSSGIVNRILIAFFLDIDPSKANFIQIPTGLTHIQKSEAKNRFRFICINDTSHLPEKLKVRQVN